jgi:hypothetical protein
MEGGFERVPGLNDGTSSPVPSLDLLTLYPSNHGFSDRTGLIVKLPTSLVQNLHTTWFLLCLLAGRQHTANRSIVPIAQTSNGR